jgi:segregation and condensation protein B
MSDTQHPDQALAGRLEALLFVSAESTTSQLLATALGVDLPALEEGLRVLEASLADRGLRLQRHAGQLSLTTAPEFAAEVERFLGLEASTHLSHAALDTLAIIAYRQPVTRPQIDSIRGVNSESMMRSLLHKGLITESGRADGPGRPILYSTTPELLQHFGISSVAELPSLDLAVHEDQINRDELLKG